MKSTAIAPSNLAFIKYWGKSDEVLKLPLNGSISMNLSGMRTTTTVEFSEKYKKDEIEISGINSDTAVKRVVKHLDLIRNIAKTGVKARVLSKNSFPSATGLSSSASGFAALTVAVVNALGLKLSEKEITVISRQGSGSSCRSTPSGFVEWVAGKTSVSSYAYSVFPPDWLDIADIVAVISSAKKEVSSTDGQKITGTSLFMKTRLENISGKLRNFKNFLKSRDFTRIGSMAEAEALEMHAVMMTSIPSLIYFEPATISMMKFVKRLRDTGLEVYFSLNTGQDMHIICKKNDVQKLVSELKTRPEVREIIINYPAKGAELSEKHLF